jgi:hypothetical protein
MRQSTAVENPAPTPSTDAPEDLSPASMAAALASAAEEGHFDELRGRAARDDETYTLELSDKWTQFFEALGTAGFADLNCARRSATTSQLQRLPKRSAAPLGAGPVPADRGARELAAD